MEVLTCPNCVPENGQHERTCRELVDYTEHIALENLVHYMDSHPTSTIQTSFHLERLFREARAALKASRF